jgi:uncharacterized membrane protein (GlpM family)
MFRTSQGPSSGSHELRSTEVTGIGSVLAVAACMVSVWLHILTLSVSLAPVKAVLLFSYTVQK